MSGLGDEVVTRCASCGYALTSRRYAVPQGCPICRAQLDPNSAPTPLDVRDETDARHDEELTHASVSSFTPAATPASESETGPTSSTPDASSSTPDAPTPEESSPLFGEVTNVTPPATVTSPLDAGELWSEFGEQPPRPAPTERAEPAPRAESKQEDAPAPSQPTSSQPAPSQPASSQPAPSTARPPNSFPQSSPLGLSAAADVPRPAPPVPLKAHDAHAPFSTPNAAPAQVQRLDAPRARGAFEEGVAPKVISRYRDGYRAARTTAVLGILIGVFGALLGLAVLVALSVLGASSADGSRVGFGGLGLGLLFGVTTFAVFFVLGVLVSSHGQLRRAALDAAVNSSPFLTNEERAEVLSLR